MNHRVVVTGMGVVAPNGVGLSDYSRALRAGESGIRHAPIMEELKLLHRLNNGLSYQTV